MKKCFLLEVVKFSPKILPLLFPITTAASRFWLRLEGTSMKAIGGKSGRGSTCCVESRLCDNCEKVVGFSCGFLLSSIELVANIANYVLFFWLRPRTMKA